MENQYTRGDPFIFYNSIGSDTFAHLLQGVAKSSATPPVTLSGSETRYVEMGSELVSMSYSDVATGASVCNLLQKRSTQEVLLCQAIPAFSLCTRFSADRVYPKKSEFAGERCDGTIKRFTVSVSDIPFTIDFVELQSEVSTEYTHRVVVRVLHANLFLDGRRELCQDSLERLEETTIYRIAEGFLRIQRGLCKLL